MRTTLLALFLLGSLWCPAQEKSKPGRQYKEAALVVVEEIQAERASNGRITLDGTVRNAGDFPIKGGLILYFEFQDSDGKTIASRHGTVKDGDFEAQETVSFGYESPDIPRAVQVVVRASNKGKIQVDVRNPGPHWIE